MEIEVTIEDQKITYISVGEFSQRLSKIGIVRATTAIRGWCRKGLPGTIKVGRDWEIDEQTVQYVADGKWRC